MSKHPGKFITFEGIEGSGKSTNIKYVANLLSELNIPYILTREPGGTELGEKVREILLDSKFNIDASTEMLLMFATRAEHVKKVILPALQAGKVVLSDRYYDASFAYQGGGRKIPYDRIFSLSFDVLELPTPDATFLFDVTLETSLNRLKERGNRDRIELETIEFFRDVKNTYLSLAEKNKDRFIVIDADNSLENIQNILASRVKHMLNIKD